MSVTTCPQGHPYNDLNTYITKDGYKHCRTCMRDRMRVRRQSEPRPGQGWKNAAKTHCPKGHEYTPENTLIQKASTTKGTKRACKTCAAENSRIQRIKKYGITPEQFEELYTEQKGKCKICEISFDDAIIYIDHDHSCCSGQKACGKCVRGLLCPSCNTSIGLMKDSPELLRKAADYLSGTIS